MPIPAVTQPTEFLSVETGNLHFQEDAMMILLLTKAQDLLL